MFDRFAEMARLAPRHIVLPEGGDARVVEAARVILDNGVATVTLVGAPGPVDAAARDAGVSLDGIAVCDPARDERAAGFAQVLAERRDDWSLEKTTAWMADPLYFAGMLTATGQADAMIAGAANETGRVISAGLRTIGLKPGIDRLSSFFLMQVPDFRGTGAASFIFADCAVNIEPDAEQLADIAIASAENASKLLAEAPRVALLSFSTKGSASHASVDTVTAALDLIRQRAPELAVDGELQADSALIPSVAARKVKDKAGVAGQANVLIFPDLASGNIGYKLVQYMANATATGPFFQGFAKPVCDLSRGCSVQDIVAAATIMLATAE